jgi:hypothetical protein
VRTATLVGRPLTVTELASVQSGLSDPSPECSAAALLDVVRLGSVGFPNSTEDAIAVVAALSLADLAQVIAELCPDAGVWVVALAQAHQIVRERAGAQIERDRSVGDRRHRAGGQRHG